MTAIDENKLQYANKRSSSFAYEWPGGRQHYNLIRNAAMRGKFSPEFYMHAEGKKAGIIHISFTTPNVNRESELERICAQLDKIVRFEAGRAIDNLKAV